MIVQTLNPSAIVDGPAPFITLSQSFPTETMVAAIFMYASLLVSVVVAFIAVLAKQWLNQYLQHADRPVTERCADRQLKYDALEKWAFRSIIDSLPVTLQVSLLLFVCGLYQYLAPLKDAVTHATDILITLGFMLYSCIVIAGLSSPACPYQTLGSAALRSIWKKTRPVIFSVIPHSRRGLPQVQQGPLMVIHHRSPWRTYRWNGPNCGWNQRISSLFRG